MLTSTCLQVRGSGRGQGARAQLSFSVALWPVTVGSGTGLELNPVQQAEPPPHRLPSIMLMLKPRPFPWVLLPILESPVHSGV